MIKYRMVCMVNATGDTHRTISFDDDVLLKEVANDNNIKWPEMYHWIEEVEAPVEPTDTK